MSVVNELSALHPELRSKVTRLIKEMRAQGHNFHVFETLRTGIRQAELHAIGRTKPGSIVTKAKPYTSHHQFGTGCDIVLKINGKWSWSQKGRFASAWKDMRKEAHRLGLKTIKWDLPHVQLANANVSNMKKRGIYPPGGDHAWASRVAKSMHAYNKRFGTNFTTPKVSGGAFVGQPSQEPAARLNRIAMDLATVSSGEVAMVNVNSSLNMRSGPGAEFSKIGSLQNGRFVAVLDVDGDWAKVSLENDEKPDGFVHIDFLIDTGVNIGEVVEGDVPIDDWIDDLPIKVVDVRSDLNVRGGPGANFEITDSLLDGAKVVQFHVKGDWAKISANMDHRVDGFVFASFLKDTGVTLGEASVSDDEDASDTRTPIFSGEAEFEFADEDVDFEGAEHGEDELNMTADRVASIFGRSARSNVIKHWPTVRQGLIDQGLYDKQMVAYALATIMAETSSFAPISEVQGKSNTSFKPFDKYDPGTTRGKKLGNKVKGDGARFKGRGFIQLTGRWNYNHHGNDIGVDLISKPELANEPEVAGLLFASYLKRVEDKVRRKLDIDDLPGARKAVVGKRQVLKRYENAYNLALELMA